MSAALPIIGLHPDYLEAQDEAFDKALSAAADDALSLNGRADEAVCGPAVTRNWALKQGARFDPAPWLDDDGTFAEQLPRDDCPADVLQMFLWTGSERQIIRAVYLLRDLVRPQLATEGDVIERAERASVPRSKARALSHYSAMAQELAA